MLLSHLIWTICAMAQSTLAKIHPATLPPIELSEKPAKPFIRANIRHLI
jgi:hypothetical protein